MPSIKREGRVFPKWGFWVLVLIIIIIAVAYFWTGGFQKSYYAVYLRTGEIYFGQVTYFPRMAVVDPLILQLTGDESNPFSISRFKDSFWGPEEKIYLNGDNVVWKAKVSEDSNLMKALEDPDLISQNNAAASQGVNPDAMEGE